MMTLRKDFGSLLCFVTLLVCIFSSATESWASSSDRVETSNHLSQTRDDSLQWVNISLPAQEIVNEFEMLNDSLGWLLTQHQKLYQWDGKNWHSISGLHGEKAYDIFALSFNDVWVSIYHPPLYRYCLKHFDGRWWKIILTPNTMQIRDIFFLDENNGWAICQWGEIIHFNGQHWQRVACPTNYHLDCIYMASTESGMITGHNRDQGIILRYQEKQWKVFRHFPASNVGHIYAKNDSLYWVLPRWPITTILEIDGDSVRTIKIPDAFGRHEIEDIVEIQGELGVRTKKDDYYQFCNRRWKKIPRQKLAFPHIWRIGENGQLQRLMPVKKQEKSAVSLLNGFRRLEQRGTIYEYGVAMGDIDNDGLLDCYVVDHEGVNRLIGGDMESEQPYLAGSAAAEKAGIAGKVRKKDKEALSTIYDSGVSLADIDNDGDLDLYLCSMYFENILYENNGRRQFRNITERAGVGGENRKYSNMGVWSDVNNDGLVDLFVTNEIGTDILYLNDGTGRFTDITQAAGLNSQWGSQSAAFSDIDNDGDQDLFIPHIHGKIRLMRHCGVAEQSGLPLFKNITIEAGLDTSLVAAKLCGVFGDVDNDGDNDLFITVPLLRDKLYLNDGSGCFTDVSEDAGFTDSTNSRAALFFDADNDGFLDLYVGVDGPDKFYRNRGDGRFEECSEAMGISGDTKTTGIACGDIIDYPHSPDGAIDLYVATMDGESVVYHNCFIGTNYLKFRLTGTISNRDAIGAQVLLYDAGHLGDKAHFHGMREVQAGSGMYSMSSTIIHFGAQPGKKYDAKIIFPSGIEVCRKNLKPGCTLQIWEEEGGTRLFSESKRWILQNLKEPDNHREAALSIFSLLFMFAALFYCRKRAWGNRASQGVLFLLPILMMTLVKLLTFGKTLWLFDGLAIISAVIGLLLVLRYNYTVSQKVSREERLNELLLTARSFEHSQWLASYFNQLGLLFNNIEPGRLLSPEVNELAGDSISQFYQFVYSELQRMVRLTRQVFPTSLEGEKLKKNLLELSLLLDRVKITISLKREISTELIQRVPVLISLIQNRLKMVSSLVNRHFSSPLLQVLNKITQKYIQKKISVELQNSIQAEEVFVRIRHAELLFVLENLFENARRAMTDSKRKKITLDLTLRDFHVLLAVKDTGAGIPPAQQERLFDDGFTSKKEQKGGFGLFRSKLLLHKYGGNITLQQTTVGTGTVFCVELRRVDQSVVSS